MEGKKPQPFTVPVHTRVVGAEAQLLAGSQKPAEERATTVAATPPIYFLMSSHLVRKEMQSGLDINTIERWFPSASPMQCLSQSHYLFTGQRVQVP